MTDSPAQTQTCPDCGAVNPAGAAKCSLCYLPLLAPLVAQENSPASSPRKPLFQKSVALLSAVGTAFMVAWSGIIAFLTVCFSLGAMGEKLAPPGPSDSHWLVLMILAIVGFVLGLVAAAYTMRYFANRWTSPDLLSSKD